MKKLLIQAQLSNYTKEGVFVLDCDSGWQMVMSRARQLLKLVPDLQIDVVGPLKSQVLTPWNTPDPRIRHIEVYTPPSALLSRHHFDARIQLDPPYDAAYINDPMQLRNYMAVLGNKCRVYASHNHFVDNPSCPKFGGMLWHGQCEAVRRADVNFWQCESALREFEADFGGTARNSHVWDDGYSTEEITSPINVANVRFALPADKPIVFVPNRVGGRGVSSDYTNCGKFLFEVLPQLRKVADFHVVAGNPGQKFSNKQLVEECGVLDLVPGPLTRDEYKVVASNSALAVALYDRDTDGRTAIRECVELGCLPLWLDCNEYVTLSRKARYPFTCKLDFSDIVETAVKLLSLGKLERQLYSSSLKHTIEQQCSIEVTTHAAAKRMELL